MSHVFRCCATDHYQGMIVVVTSQIRLNTEREMKTDERPAEEQEASTMKECEVNYVKKFQSWQVTHH